MKGYEGEVTVDDEELRLTIYRSFADTGREPELPDGDATRSAIHRLAAARHVVLDAHDRIVMAHPFASIPLGFAVMGRATLWWGGCAWDSFAVPHLVDREPEVLVSTQCPACAAPHAWVVGRDAPPTAGQVAHFLTPVAHMWDDVVHTCGHQRIFCDERCVDTWLSQTRHDKGYVMDLATLWRLARGWYAGRLDRGYERRDPASAAAYFEDVGLTGPFWGLSSSTT
jgi:Alkylmercury lyase